jgi:uncharacterized membrane protein
VIKRNYPLILILISFFLIYCLLAIVNHFSFRTYALDLGVFNQAIYFFSKGQNAIYTLDLTGQTYPFLATHFSPILILFSPLRYLFGSYTLLVIQVLFILFGAVGIHKIAIDKYKFERRIALIFVIHFLSIWGIYSALSFDFHMNVIGAMCIPWFVYYFKDNSKYAFFFLFFILLTIEVFGIFLFFIILTFIIKEKLYYLKDYYLQYIQLLICVVYVFLVILIVMPLLQDSTTNLQLNRYEFIGRSPSEMISFIFTKPIEFWNVFIGNKIDSIYDGIKLESVLMILFSGGLAFFVRPIYLLILLPILAIKFLSNDCGFWGINNQYSIELVPIISLVFIDLTFKFYKYKRLITLFILTTTILGTIQTMNSRKSKWYNEKNNNLFSKEHYQSEFQNSKLNKIFKTIGKEEIVSAVTNFVPHLAFRKKIYQFPIVKDATTIVLTIKEGFNYPLTQEEYNNEIKMFKLDSSFRIAYSDKTLIIFKKKFKK